MPKNVLAADPLRAAIREEARAVVREELALGAPARSRWMRRNDSPVPEKVLRAPIATGEIDSLRLGKFVYLDRDSHDAWLAKNAVKVGAANDAPTADESDDVLAAFGVVRRAGR